jgi:histidinol-phosphate aminotransferase
MAVARAKPGIEKIVPHMLSGGGPFPPATILLNSNESVLGPSPIAMAAARSAICGIERYVENPDQLLAPEIAKRFDLDPARITIGQGSDDLLARLARGYLGPDTNLVRSANGYLKVPNYAHANDADVVSVPDDNFVPSVDNLIAGITDKTHIVYLANPENPAGTYLSGVEVRRLHAAMPETALLVIDAAYEEYVDAPDYEPADKLVDDADNVVMCRTFSKIYGLAGARVGWLYGPVDVVDTVRRIALTFPVASPSIAAVIAAMEDREHTKSVFNANKSGRDWLSKELLKLGLNVIPSQGNFILIGFHEPQKSAIDVRAELRAKGIAIQRFAAPAYSEFIRITVGRPEELRATVDAIRNFLNGGTQ